MRISVMPVKTAPTGIEYVPIFDPNEPSVSLRNKRVLLSAIMGGIGPEGKSAYQVWLDNGNIGTEQEFLEDITGAAGPSNYQVWLDDGNVGSVDDFFETLKGTPGTIWYNADGAPSSGVGVTGDYYIDTNNGQVYYREVSGWQAESLILKGTQGSVWHRDGGPPNVATGGERDFFLDSSNGDVYGPKLFGDWGSPIINLKGPAGVSWYSAVGAPDNGDGSDGDYYIDLNNGEVYGPKTAGDWGVSVGNLKGPAGVAGAAIITGNGAPDVGDGNNNDYYLDLDTGEFYGPKLPGDWGSPIVQLLQDLDNVLSFGATSETPIEITYSTGDTGSITHHGEYTEYKHNDAGGGSQTRLRGSMGMAGIAANVLLPAYSGTLITQDDLDNAINALPDPITYIGVWNATTNTPTLADADSYDNGSLFRVTVAGTQDLGSGPIEFRVGDRVVKNDSGIYEKWDVNDEILSVNGYSDPDIVLDTDDIDEGLTNLYFTEDRAQDAVGNILVDSAWIDFIYTPGTPAITAELVDGSIGNEKLTNSSITIAGTEVELGDDIDLDTITGLSGTGIIKRTGVNTYAIAVSATDYAPATNGTNNQALTSNGAGGFGTAVTLAASATTDTTNADNITTGVLGSSRGGAGTVNGLLKANGSGVVSQAVAGTDYAEATNGTNNQVLTSDGAGGFGTPLTVGTDLAPLVAGLVPAMYLPSYVDDVLEVDDYDDLPVTGESDKIYIVKNGGDPDPDTPANAQYRWTGSVYVMLVASPGTTDNVPEGVVNLYFEDGRAQAAVVVQTITNGDTTHAPSGDVVFDALALKADTSSLAPSATTDTTNADNITSGTLHKNRGGAGDVTGILKANGAGVVSAAVSGTDYAPATSGTGILKGDGAGGTTTATSGTDYVVPSQLITALPLYDSDDNELVALGVLKSFRIPYNFTAIRVKGNLKTAQATGTLITIDVKKNGVTIFSTLLTFDNASLTTVGATTPAVISVSSFADDDLVETEVTVIGDGTAEGLQLWLVGVASP